MQIIVNGEQLTLTDTKPASDLWNRVRQEFVSDSCLCAHVLIYSSKFIDKFGKAAFRTQYMPLYKLHGKKHLPGLRFMFNDEEEEKAWVKAEKEKKARKQTLKK